jgi:Predicted transcriptional regulator
LTSSPKKKPNEIRANCISGISSIEADIMKIIWGRGPLSVREVYEIILRKEMEDKKASFIPYTSVMSTMIALANKGFLRQDKNAKTYIYTAVVDRKELSKNIINSVAEKLLEATTDMVYKSLSNEENVSMDGVKKLLNEIK